MTLERFVWVFVIPVPAAMLASVGTVLVFGETIPMWARWTVALVVLVGVYVAIARAMHRLPVRHER